MASADDDSCVLEAADVPKVFKRGMRNLQQVLLGLNVGSKFHGNSGDFDPSAGVNKVGIKMAIASFLALQGYKFEPLAPLRPVPSSASSSEEYIYMLCKRNSDTLIMEVKCIKAAQLLPPVRGFGSDKNADSWGTIVNVDKDGDKEKLRTRLSRIRDTLPLRARDYGLGTLKYQPAIGGQGRSIDDAHKEALEFFTSVLWRKVYKQKRKERVFLATVGIVGNVIAWWNVIGVYSGGHLEPSRLD